jgi:ABC-2 type transport system ATP-binding protein
MPVPMPVAVPDSAAASAPPLATTCTGEGAVVDDVDDDDEGAGGGVFVHATSATAVHEIQHAARVTGSPLPRVPRSMVIARPVISVSHLVKRYGSRLAVDDVSFEVEKGDVVGFLGPNGAGKSTTLRILSGFLGMTSGSVKVLGHDIVNDSMEARKKIGYMPEAVPLYPEMRVAEYLTFRAELKGVPRARRRGQVDDAMDKASVFDVATTLIGQLSKGYRQRVGLADALVANPPILILDEPTAGLDPNQIRDVRAVIKDLAAEHTILLSTHILSEVEASCGKVVVIAKGKLLAEGPTTEIQKMRRVAALAIKVRGDVAAAMKALREIDGVAKVKEVLPRVDGVTLLHATWTTKLPDDAIAQSTERAVAAVIAAGVPIREVKAVGSSLEEVFAALTKDSAVGGGGAGDGANEGDGDGDSDGDGDGEDPEDEDEAAQDSEEEAP